MLNLFYICTGLLLLSCVIGYQNTELIAFGMIIWLESNRKH